MCFLQSCIAIAIGVEMWVSKFLNLIIKFAKGNIYILKTIFWSLIDYVKLYKRVFFVEEEFAPSTKRKFTRQWRVALLPLFEWSRLPPDVSAPGPDTLDTSGGS